MSQPGHLHPSLGIILYENYSYLKVRTTADHMIKWSGCSHQCLPVFLWLGPWYISVIRALGLHWAVHMPHDLCTYAYVCVYACMHVGMVCWEETWSQRWEQGTQPKRVVFMANRDIEVIILGCSRFILIPPILLVDLYPHFRLHMDLIQVMRTLVWILVPRDTYIPNAMFTHRPPFSFMQESR